MILEEWIYQTRPNQSKYLVDIQKRTLYLPTYAYKCITLNRTLEKYQHSFATYNTGLLPHIENSYFINTMVSLTYICIQCYFLFNLFNLNKIQSLFSISLFRGYSYYYP